MDFRGMSTLDELNPGYNQYITTNYTIYYNRYIICLHPSQETTLLSAVHTLTGQPAQPVPAATASVPATVEELTERLEECCTVAKLVYKVQKCHGDTVYMYIYIYIYLFFFYLFAFVCIYLHLFAFICIYLHLFAFICIYLHLDIYIYLFIYIQFLYCCIYSFIYSFFSWYIM